MRRVVNAIILIVVLAFIGGFSVSLALGQMGSDTVTITVTAQPVYSPPGDGGIADIGDTRAPVISNIECSDCTKTSIIIKWITDERSTSQVEYWASEHMFSPLDESLVLHHEVMLTDLKPCCVYHFRTISKDRAGNEKISDEGTFTTLGTPATFATTDLTISPTVADIGESVSISVVVTNTGDLAGSYEVMLEINGAVEATEEVTINAGAGKQVSFATSKDTPDLYLVEVNGLTGSFEVEQPLSPVEPTPAKPINWWLIGGIIAAAVVVGLLVFFLVRRRAA